MTTFYVTFGLGTPLANCYATVEADNELDARYQIIDVRGGDWASIYDDDDATFDESYEVPLDADNDPRLPPLECPRLSWHVDNNLAEQTGMAAGYYMLDPDGGLAYRGGHTWGPPITPRRIT